MHHSFKGLRGVYLTTFFLNSGLGLVGIFIPIYIWHLGGGISSVFYFFAFYYLTVTLVSPLAGWLFKNLLSPDFAYLLSAVIRLIYLFFLVNASTHYYYLWLAAFFWALAIPFCWFPYYLTVTHEGNKDGKFGQQVSNMGILSQVAAAVAPILGGLAIAHWGFSFSYYLAGFFFLLSILPLYFDHYNPRRIEFSLKDSLSFISRPAERKLNYAFFGSGLGAVANIAWPLFIFFKFKAYQTLGWIRGLALLFSVLVLAWTGRFVDKKGKGILNWGVWINFFNWLLRILASSALSFFLFDFLAILGGILVGTPLQALIYEKARGRYSPLEVFVAQGMLSNFGGFLGCLLLAFLVNSAHFWFLAFAMGALGVFLIRGNDGHKIE